MTAPTFTCRCIEQAEADTALVGPEWCGEICGNHISEFGWDVWRSYKSPLASRLMSDHYEAHALGSPHSHIRLLKGNDVFPSGFSWDAVECSCHHVEQNAELGPDVMRRGPGLTNAEYIASAP